MHTLLHHDGGPGTGGPGRPAGAALRRPRADCTADSAGGLTFDVAAPGGEEDWGAALLLRRRGGPGPGGSVRLPLFPSGPGRLRAALPSTMPLAEGRWDAFLASSGGPPRRLRPGSSDLDSLVERVPGVHRTWLGVRIPYATRHDNLTVRAWLRWPHAEASRVVRTERGVSVRGRLYGAQLGRGAVLETLPRQRSGGPLRSAVGPVAGDGAEFGCELPCEALDGPGLWHLWLRPSAAAEPVRLARILDDLPDKRRLELCPPLALDGLSVTPCYTSSNDLALRAERTGTSVTS